MNRVHKLDIEDKLNFELRSKFPGEEGNPFDKTLRKLQKINQIPTIFFFILILFFTGIFSFFNTVNWLILFLFTLLDSIIIASLPTLKISFGSYKSQVLLLAILRTIFIWFPFPINLAFQYIGTILVIFGFMIEPSSVIITNIQTSTEQRISKLHFIHLADIHMEKISIREKKIIEIIKQRRPDFILFTGDFLNLSFNQNEDSINQVINFFNQINTIAPVYYVSGSSAVDLDMTLNLIENKLTPIRLNNNNLVIKYNETEINLVGISCTHRPHEDIKILPGLLDKNRLNILLYHSPDLIFELDNRHKVDIMLSGHTHGGQVRIPFLGAFFTGSLYGRKLQNGMYKFNNTLLYISRGIGLEGLGAPRVRIFCSPEIIEWKINY